MLSSTPPRRIAFTTTDRDGVRKLAWSWIDNSCSTQNRLDAVMLRLGRWYELMRFCLLARARGHGDLPSFCEGNREAAGRALLALTSLAAKPPPLAARSPVEAISCIPPAVAAVAEAFPAAMMGCEPESVIGGKGLGIIRGAEEEAQSRSHRRSDADAAVQAAAAKLVLLE